MAATVKAWHMNDCRRLSIDIEQIQYQDLKKKLQNTFNLDDDITVKYADVDGDLCTIGGKEELEDLVNSELVKNRKGTVRLQVIPAGSSPHPSSMGANGLQGLFHRRSPSDSAGDGKAGRGSFDNEYTDRDMLEIIRDISLFICARENALADLPPGASSWVSAGKNLITPTTAQNFQRLNYARAVRARFPVSSSADTILHGFDGHVYLWSVDITGQWLVKNGYEDSVQVFKEHDITGDVLLDLSHDTLKDMGMTSTGRRIRLLKLIAELRLHVADLTIQEATEKTSGCSTNEQDLSLDSLAIH